MESGVHNQDLSSLPETRANSGGRAWFSFRGVPTFVMIVVGVLPFWAMPVAHIASGPETATGFFHEELPYYMANGRAAFDRGNGVMYPNPYDPDLNAPVIYAHWLLWMFGVAPRFFGTDPGQLMLALTFFASIGFSWATWLLVKEHTLQTASRKNAQIHPDFLTDASSGFHQPTPHAAYLMAMWGGGILVVGGWIAMLLGSGNSTLLQFDPGSGLWFLNWGRNATFATEAVYHTLVAFCWLSEMKDRRIAGTAFCFALATTHPWSGVELLLTLNLWRSVQWLRERDKRSLVLLCTAMGMLLVFLIYYKVWLPTFPQHARLQNVWELDWSLSTVSAVFGWCIVGAFALARLAQSIIAVSPRPIVIEPSNRKSADRTGQQSLVNTDLTSVQSKQVSLSTAELFLCCAAAVAMGLALHDRLMKPVQPLHFTRGYIWMPLFLLGLPVMQSWWNRSLRSGLRGKLAVVGFVLMFIADNAGFAWIQSSWELDRTRGYHLSLHDRALIADLHKRTPGAVVLTESPVVNYLIPAYANLRPWLGHQFNTPDHRRRAETMASIFADEKVHVNRIPDDIDLLVIQRTRDDSELIDSPEWIALETPNAEWQAWGQTRDSGTFLP
ncbi:MAG: hypothetical protein R3C20_24090 [Planctomycetaceae bacterium]